jgi:hypothetical protein
MPNEFIIRNGLIVESGTTTVTGSITATGGFTGSLLGTASVATSLAGGALTNFIEGFSSVSQSTSFFSASNAAATVNFAIIPKGSGSIIAAVPDGLITGGNARGTFVVDLQQSRSLATQVASGIKSVIGGGVNNTAGIENATIAGGISNQAYALCTIGGGFNNTASTATPSATGSVTLTAGSTSLPGAYINSTLTQTNMLIRGVGIPDNTYISQTAPPNLGMSNPATVSGAQTLSYFYTGNTIAGGRSNNAAGMYTTIGGGLGNTVSGNNTGVAAGSSNSAGGTNSFVGGGLSNTAGGNYDVVCGGQSNSVTDTNNGSHRFVGAGSSNSMGQQCLYSIIVGGQGSTIFGRNNFIGGGASHGMTSATYTVIVGGQSNSVGGAGASHQFIGGGQSNTVNVTYATIGGGFSNSVVGSIGFVGGGRNNSSSGTLSAIAGGSGSIASNIYSFVGGGERNLSSNTASFVGGGSLNTGSGAFSTIGGGSGSIASGTYSIITGGNQGSATLYGQQAHASGRFATTGDAQAHELIWRSLVTGTSPTELFLDGSSTRAILPTTNTIWRGVVDIAAVCTNAGGGTTVVGDVAAGSYEVTIKRLNTSTTLVGTVQIIGTLDTDASMSTANFTIGADDTNEALIIIYIPPATADGTTTFRVVATFRGLQIQY